MDTIYLDPTAWDLVVDVNGNIAMASSEYAIAQDVASACRLFSGELYYDQTKGVPYQTAILGKRPSRALVASYMTDAALTVPDVVAAEVIGLSLVGRSLAGNIQVIDRAGQKIGVTF